MTTKAGKESIYKSIFDESIEGSNQPQWLKDLRRKAFNHFSENGFPAKKDEEWKYTSVSGEQLAVTRGVSDPDPTDGNERAREIVADIGAKNILVFIDGVYSEDLSKIDEIPENIKIADFAQVLDDDTFRSNFGKVVEFDLNGFVALNTAFTDQGIFVHVPKNTKVDTPLHIVFIGRSETANFSRILYVGETGSEAEIIEHYTRTEESAYFTNAVVEVNLADNARLTHTRVQRESHQATHILTSEADLNRSSVYDNTNITLGAKLSRHDVNLKFNEEGGEAWIDGLYLVEDGQHTDTHSRIDHKVKNCNSHQNYKGILDGKSRAVFNGKVYVHENASGTDAQQSNKNLLLSNDARVDTKPQLEIFNDDVKCAHGATVGQLEEEELFYLLSRGLNEDLARNLLTYGFAEEIINKIEIESIKKQLDEAVLNRLHARLEA